MELLMTILGYLLAALVVFYIGRGMWRKTVKNYRKAQESINEAKEVGRKT